MGLTYNTGVKRKPLTPEQRSRISKSMKGGNSTSFKKGVSSWNKGKSWSEETREKMRQAKLKNPVRYWKNKERPEMSGSNNPNFRKLGKEHPKWTEDKKHPFHKSIRETYKYKQWRLERFIFDDYSCLLCGMRGGELQVDHFPKTFIEIINEYQIKTIEKSFNCEELWNIQNGRTLCVNCHRKTDTWGKRKII